MKQISKELVQNILSVLAAAVHPSTPFNAILSIGQQLEQLKDAPESPVKEMVALHALPVKESIDGGTAHC